MSSSPAIQPLIEFGIGCYSFEAPTANNLTMQNRDGDYTIHDWASDVEDALKSIPSLDEIKVAGFRSVRGDHAPTWRNAIELVVRDMPHDSTHRGGDLRPHPVSGTISFVATVPTHTQREVFSFGAPMKGTRFEVDIRYGYGMPIAFVRAPSGTVNPSHAVAIVREFLRAEFTQRVDARSPIRFTCMGPSPMWNDCFVELSELPLTASIEVDIVDPPGYQEITFRVDSTAGFTTIAESYELVKDATQDELALYYELVSRRNILALHRDFIESQLESLVTEHRRNGIGAWFSRLFTGGQKANDLMLEILAADTEFQKTMGGAQREWEEVRGRSAVHAFDKAFERELNHDGPDYTSNAQAVVSLLNARHSHDVQVFSVILSSLLGGAVGAALTAVVQISALAGSTTVP